MLYCPKCNTPLDERYECAKCGPLQTKRNRQLGALAYFWITALVFLYLPRYRHNSYVRFHSLQAALYGLAAMLVNIAFGLFAARISSAGAIVLAYVAVWGLVRLGFMMLWVLALFRAYQGFEYKLPLVGLMAERWKK
jgi:uncharacterized membrane protein